jgi:hypothetical protein
MTDQIDKLRTVPLMDFKIRNATLEQLPIVIEIVRKYMGEIHSRGTRNGIGIRQNGISVYLYIAPTGKTVVALVSLKETT